MRWRVARVDQRQPPAILALKACRSDVNSTSSPATFQTRHTTRCETCTRIYTGETSPEERVAYKERQRRLQRWRDLGVEIRSMDGGSSRPYMRRESNKVGALSSASLQDITTLSISLYKAYNLIFVRQRSFSTMAASHREDAPVPDLELRDEHYGNEQSSRRRRLNTPPRVPHLHYPGDGFDFRRPIMSTSVNEQEASVDGRSGRTVVIDLTEENGAETSQHPDRLSVPLREASRSERAHAGSSRAQRLPRWDRALINSPSSGEEEADNTTPPRSTPRHFALPGRRHPQFSSLRRPASRSSPPAEMDGEDVEVVASQAAPRRQRRTVSRRSTPARLRSMTPHATSQNQYIDLTQDDDDEVVHLDTRQREGAANRERPVPTANVGTRGLAIGDIANFVREQGGNIGGRLMQRLGEFAGFQGELQAQQQAFDHFQHNHGNHHAHHAHHHAHHHHHQHAHRHQGHRTAHLPVGNLGGLLQMGAPPGMNFGMTGFDMGMGGNREETPKYEPPSEPETGFTRSPGEDEVVVCPNCGDELAMGDSEMKQEVWVIKTCGHVSLHRKLLEHNGS